MEKIFYEGISGKFPYRPRSFDKIVSGVGQFRKISMGFSNYQEWVFKDATLTYTLDHEENAKVLISGKEEYFIDIEDQIDDAEKILREKIESALERISTKIKKPVKV